MHSSSHKKDLALKKCRSPEPMEIPKPMGREEEEKEQEDSSTLVNQIATERSITPSDSSQTLDATSGTNSPTTPINELYHELNANTSGLVNNSKENLALPDGRFWKTLVKNEKTLYQCPFESCLKSISFLNLGNLNSPYRSFYSSIQLKVPLQIPHGRETLPLRGRELFFEIF